MQLTNLHHYKPVYYEMLHRALGLDGFFGITYVMEIGYQICNIECYESLQGRFTENSIK
jgi:hypothetical protein